MKNKPKTLSHDRVVSIHERLERSRALGERFEQIERKKQVIRNGVTGRFVPANDPYPPKGKLDR